MKSSARISEKSIFENVRSFDGGRERKAFFRELNFEHKKKEKRTTFVHQNAKFRKSQGNEKGKERRKLISVSMIVRRERPRSVYLAGY